MITKKKGGKVMLLNEYLVIATFEYISANLYLDLMSQFNDPEVTKDIAKGRIAYTLLYIFIVVMCSK